MVERETKTVQGILIEHTEGGKFTSGAAEETKMSPRWVQSKITHVVNGRAQKGWLTYKWLVRIWVARKRLIPVPSEEQMNVRPSGGSFTERERCFRKDRGRELVLQISFSCYYPIDATVNLRQRTVPPMACAFRNKCVITVTIFSYTDSCQSGAWSSGLNLQELLRSAQSEQYLVTLFLKLLLWFHFSLGQ